ncbi:uncharacterized protein Dmoj_GI22507 [Drosophila mojavensis]|uniref:Uncharacterized protein n=1 Tax=Drosophila mojavensis TaxID=7230 RepID=B4KCT1_DROMO|nr:uncharacterized protein Dmoj_GI22507 [Drosophila mojavensis]
MSDGSNASLYKKCKKRADVYVKQVIAEQDAAYNHNIPHNIAIRNFVRKIDPETFSDETSLTNRGKAEISKSKESSTKKNEGQGHEKQNSSRKEQSDTELSQVTQTSSDESKTFSQIYSEICEESRARQKKAEQIYRIITHKETNQSEDFFRSKSRERTARWVHNLGELRKDGESTTETSNETDKESEYCQSSTNDHYFTEDECKYLMPEELDMIDSFKQALRSGYTKNFVEYVAEMKNVQSEYHEPVESHSSRSEFKGSTRERNSIKSESHAVGSEKPRSQSLQNCSKLTENEVGKSKVLQFEHCEIYIRSSEPLQKTPTKAGSSARTESGNQMNSSPKKSEECLDLKQSGSKSKNVNTSTNKVQSSIKLSPERKSRKSDTKVNAVYKKQFKENSSVDYVINETDNEPSFGKSNIWEQNEANSSTYSLESTKEIISQRSEYNESFNQAEETMSNTSLNSAKSVVSKNEKSKQYEENTSNISFEAIEEQHLGNSAYTSDADRVEEMHDNSLDSSMSHEESESQAYSSQHKSNSNHNSSSEVEQQSQKSFTKDEKLKWLAQLAWLFPPRIERRKFLMLKDFNQLNADKRNETERSESCDIRKSRRHGHRLNKSESASINSQKSLHSAMNSTWPTERSTSDMHVCSTETNDGSLAYENDSGDDYYLSSQNTSANTSLISSALSMPNVTKKYRDRASSPIQVIYSDHSDSYERTVRLERIGYNKPGDRRARSRGRKMKSEQLPKERSQTSIASEEKGVQYPSDDELNDSAKNSTKSVKICKRDEALQKVPKHGKGKEKKGGSSSNSSSCHSLPTGNSGNSSSTANSSAYSICNYVPSVRFHRRTEPEEDVVMDLAHNDNDPPALTYKKHVARLAEHALRTCTNYYKESVEHSPELEEDIATKVGMLYNSETKFNTTQRLDKQEDLMQQFNQQLHEQLKLVPPNVQ